MTVKAKCISDIQGRVILLEDALYQAIISKRGKRSDGDDDNDATLNLNVISYCHYESQDILTKCLLDWNQKIQVLILRDPHIYRLVS